MDVIADVLWNGPADKARLAPGEKIIAVNGQIFLNDVLREAIREAKGSTEPIQLIVQADNCVRTQISTTTMASAIRRWSGWTERRIIWTTSPSR